MRCRAKNSSLPGALNFIFSPYQCLRTRFWLYSKFDAIEILHTKTMAGESYVTLATNDTYALGALVLAHSLRKVGTTKQLTVLVTPGVSVHTRPLLASVFDVVEHVDILDSKDEVNLELMTRPELGITFTKLHCWRLTQFSKCVFLDADTMVLQNCDELFERDELSAVPDVGWPDCFNSGVFVYAPSNETYRALLQFAIQKGSFDGGDQGLLNMFFSDWATKDISKHLSFIYNMNSNASYTYLPAYKQFGGNVKIVHFLGSVKPWMHNYSLVTGQVELRGEAFHAKEHLQAWWNVFMKNVQPLLQPECQGVQPAGNVEETGLAGHLANMSLWSQEGAQGVTEQERQYAWERGQIDYLGVDCFENIQRKLDDAIKDPSSL